tara:strand:+ start:943 stop:1155 length:213 start_codon:yes stop_codon:yes gene_type:complete
MANMSYCRFENTAGDLQDCLEAIENGEINDLNQYEIRGIKDVLELSKCISRLEREIEDGIFLSEQELKSE